MDAAICRQACTWTLGHVCAFRRRVKSESWIASGIKRGENNIDLKSGKYDMHTVKD